MDLENFAVTVEKSRSREVGFPKTKTGRLDEETIGSKIKRSGDFSIETWHDRNLGSKYGLLQNSYGMWASKL